MSAITELWRFPVKSMQGERIDAADITAEGIVGDRRWAIIDKAEGHVASAKHPRKWAELLNCHARLLDDGAAELALHNGAVGRSDDPDIDRILTEAFGREVTLADRAPTDRNYEMLFLDIDGVAPTDVIEQNRTADEQDGTLTRMALGMVAPPETFFDLTTLHLIRTATVDALGGDVRRFRANVVIDDGDVAPYTENAWPGATLALGAAVQAQVLMPTMRCVMTTLAQPGLPRDRGVLQTLARDNRVDVPGVGTWACAGAYATVGTPGAVAVGDAVGRTS